VYFIDRDNGYYLKRAAVGTLEREAIMTEYFHKKGLGARVLDYVSADGYDWLLTERVAGEDCTHADYISDPERLCDTIAELLRTLHDSDTAGCPVPDRMSEYIALAEENYRAGKYDLSLFGDKIDFASADEAYSVFQAGKGALERNTLLHGDYCLPNIMLDNWRFSGFIDVGNGGVGDRHVDIFWGAWTLWYNLKTDKYSHRFLDAYGRDRVDMEKLKIIAAAEVFG
jgi:kanamycin kinase